MTNVPYLPGIAPPPALPLGRFLPPIPVGMTAAWAEKNLKPGDAVLEPFGFNPLIPIEMVNAGHSVLVTANNPIHAFLIRMLASAPQEAELVAALQDLAIAARGDDRMEPYIREFYQVTCADCAMKIEAESFIWQKDADQPYAAMIACPHCGTQGEQALDSAALAALTPLPPARLHQARALSRIAPEGDPLRAQVENALSAYPIRALIVLQTIINKLESLEQTPRRRDLLIALILSAADQGNTLWAYPTPRERPRQIVVPPVFQEKNLWKALEEAIAAWQVFETPVPILEWDGQVPDQPSILLYQGRLKELTPKPLPGMIKAIIAAIPRPNQAFWTLSALWTGWIWGQSASEPIRQVLSRQRYDWNWHSNALKGVFDEIRRICDTTCKTWALVAENEPMLLLSTLLAADTVGCHLEAFAQSLDDALAQCKFDIQLDIPAAVQPAMSLAIARKGIGTFLQQKGEPADYHSVHAAAVTALANQNALAIDIFLENEAQVTSEVQRLIESIFEERYFLKRVGGGTASLDTGLWWLESPGKTDPPSIDRLERVVVRHLIAHEMSTTHALFADAYKALPGLLTPELMDVLCCLDSYGEKAATDPQCWQLRNSDFPATRKADLAAMRAALIRIGKRLDYEVVDTASIIWHENADPTAFRFHLLASAIVQTHLVTTITPAKCEVLLIPGSRANLLAYKQERNPVLRAQLESNFVVVKFRLIRDLEANPLLTRDLFRDQIAADPPEYQSSQLALL